MTANMLSAYQPEAFSRRAAGAEAYHRTPARRLPQRSATTTQWNDVVGPVLLTRQVAERMGWSPEQVDEAQKDRALLGCRTRDGVWVYPAFQFQDVASGELVHGVVDVMRVMSSAEVDSWAIASWFVTPLRTLGEQRPIDVLRADGSEGAETVRRAAMEQARAWQQ